MSTTTCRIAECAEEVRKEAVRILSLAPVLSPEALDESLRAIRLNAAMMSGLGKALSESSCVRNTSSSEWVNRSDPYAPIDFDNL